jgi:hypothetical protein
MPSSLADATARRNWKVDEKKFPPVNHKNTENKFF